MYVFIHRDISMVGNCKGNGHKVSKEFQRVTSKSSGAVGDHLDWRGSPGESIFENLKSDFSRNRLTRVEESSESQSKGRGVKDPSTTQWRRGPVRHTTKLVKVLQCLDSTSAKECGRGIPTGSRLWYQLVMPPIQTCTIKIRDSRQDIKTQL